MITGSGEQYFSAAELSESFGPGLVSSDHVHGRIWYEEPDPLIALHAGLVVARLSGVLAVAVIADHAGSVAASLAVAFAEHLVQVRRAGDLQGACLTSSSRPEFCSNAICRIPHLVTVEDGDRRRRDMVIWEIMTHERLGDWVGHTAVDLDKLERQLPYLVALRRSARQGRLPPTPAARELRLLLESRSSIDQAARR
jgi:hypothetical protein